MIRIGIVGAIGSGKTYIAKQIGFPTFNADYEVNIIYKKNRRCFKKLKKEFPKYIHSLPIKRKELLQIILNNKKNIKKINKIVHPEVRFRMNKFLKKNKYKKFIILDVPLLLEKKINKKNDILIYIKSHNKEIMKRLKKRSNFNLKVFKRLNSFQLPLEFKKKKANFIIKNNFKSLIVKKNVKLLKKELLKKYERNSFRHRNDRPFN